VACHKNNYFKSIVQQKAWNKRFRLPVPAGEGGVFTRRGWDNFFRLFGFFGGFGPIFQNLPIISQGLPKNRLNSEFFSIFRFPGFPLVDILEAGNVNRIIQLKNRPKAGCQKKKKKKQLNFQYCAGSIISVKGLNIGDDLSVFLHFLSLFYFFG